MTILSKLNLTDKTKAAMLASPEARGRQKILEAIDNQIAAAKADANGEPFEPRRMRWVMDPETGERTRKEVPLRLRRWWWKDEKGGLMLDVRYGNKRIELAPKKPTIEVGKIENLIPTLETIKEAVIAGELDKQLAAAKVRQGLTPA